MSRVSITWATALLVGILVLSSLPSVAVGAGPHGSSFGSTRGGTTVPTGPVSCSDLVADSRLSDLVSQYYPNASLLPSESQAVRAVTSTWNLTCGSNAFQQALASAAGGWFAYISQMQDKNQTSSGGLVGSLFVDFQLTWNASCPSGGGFPVGFDCQFNDLWQANLTEASVTGPASTITSLRFVPCQTPSANQTAVGSVEGFFPSSGTEPNESVAVQEVQAIWGTICTSSAYYSIASHLNFPQALGFSTWRNPSGLNGTLLGTAGHLFFQWTLYTGNGPCLSGHSVNASNSSDVLCSYSESWTADLTLNNFVGPVNTSSAAIGNGPPPAPQTSTNSTQDDWLPTALSFGLFGAFVGAVVLVGMLDKRRK